MATLANNDVALQHLSPTTYRGDWYLEDWYLEEILLHDTY